MICPFCNSERVEPSPVSGYYSCRTCGFVFNKIVESDPSGKKEKTKLELMRSRNVEPAVVFSKAISKYETPKWEVVGIKLDRGHRSLLFGEQFAVLLRKRKKQ